MKVFPRLFPIIFAFFSFGVITSARAQYLQANDEVAVIQATKIANISASSVRGVSDDGKRVVFESSADITGNNPDNNNESFLYEVDKRTFVQITNTQHIYDPADADLPFFSRRILVFITSNYPAISGDGTKIVFSSNSGKIIAGSSGANDDYNQEIYIASLPLNSSAPTFQRVTNTQATTTATDLVEVFDNHSPTINYDGSLIAFVTVIATLPGVTNPDGVDQIVLYKPSTGTFTQVTKKNEADAIDSFFNYKGFNANPQLSGNGNIIAFVSGFNHAPTSTVNNADFNGEVFFYDVTAKTITQVTNTTGFAGFPASINSLGQLVPDRPVNVFNQSTRHISNDGNLIVFESAGDLETGKNTDKTREVFIYNRTTAKFTQITANSPLTATPTDAEVLKIDFSFSPGISPNGQFVFFATILNVVPAASGVTSDPSTDNADGSKEVFRYRVSDASFRQISFTAPSGIVADQRDPLICANSNATGSEVFYTLGANITGENLDSSYEIFRAIVRPVTQTRTATAAMVNAASYYSPDITTPANNPVPTSGIAAIFGAQLANTTAVTTRADLDYTLAGTSVTIGGIAVKLFFVSPGQINFLVPRGVGTSTGVKFSVNNNGVVTTGTFSLVDAYPGIFTISQDGTGPGAVGCQIVTKDASGNVTGTSYPAPPCTISTATQDGYLLIFGTGIRNAAAGSVTVSVTNGTTTTDMIPVFAGDQGYFPGLDQINLLLPTTFPTGESTVVVKLTNATGSVTSNTFKITTATPPRQQGSSDQNRTR